jgi:hypothetical protein
MNLEIQHSLIYATVCSLVGIGIGIHIATTSIGDGYGSFPIFSSLASIVSGFLFWMFLQERRENPVHFVWISILVVTFAHYLTFYFDFIYANICYSFINGCKSSLGEPPMNPLQAIWGAGLLCLYSFLFYGWITYPAGILITFIFQKFIYKKFYPFY